ncbi:MAG: XkdX family protein [Minisyncoccales bacterium]
MFDKIKYYYDNKLWSLQRVWNVVGKANGLTEEEYQEITGFVYPDKEMNLGLHKVNYVY